MPPTRVEIWPLNGRRRMDVCRDCWIAGHCVWATHSVAKHYGAPGYSSIYHDTYCSDHALAWLMATVKDPR